jgi:glycosyltransferase involved in cell wall biosynthesis
VPAYNEERLLADTIGGIPPFVDRIFVVDDASTDTTAARAQDLDPRVQLIQRKRNGGVGAAIVTGYRQAIAESIDITCVMAGDGQMDPADLETLVGAVARGDCDYAKANRLSRNEAIHVIPPARYLGIRALSLLTKISSGYWKIGDSQSGYTAVNLATLRELDLDSLYPRYGFPNDMLVHLNVANRRVLDFPSRPIYGIGEESGIRMSRVIPTISWLLLSGFWWRIKEKYLVRDFHPLVILYALGVLSLVAGLVLGAIETGFRLAGDQIFSPAIVLVVLVAVGLQLTLLAMWLDMRHASKKPSAAVPSRATAKEQPTVSRL